MANITNPEVRAEAKEIAAEMVESYRRPFFLASCIAGAASWWFNGWEAGILAFFSVLVIGGLTMRWMHGVLTEQLLDVVEKLVEEAEYAGLIQEENAEMTAHGEVVGKYLDNIGYEWVEFMIGGQSQRYTFDRWLPATGEFEAPACNWYAQRGVLYTQPESAQLSK